MRDLIGYLKKTVFLFSLLAFFAFPTDQVKAEENFQIYTSFEHSITEKIVNTQVIIQIRTTSPKVISYYTASIPEKNLVPKCYLVKSNTKIECTTFNRGSNTDVLFDLGNSVVRPGSPLEIKILYKTESKTSEAYNISSKVLDTTTNTVLVQYPKEKGEPLWTSDPISNIKLIKENYQIIINKPVYSNISILFGKNIIYNFNINRVFQNTTTENQTFELVVPPDTKDQSIIWENISPLPNSSTLDEDGNYIFKYIVPPEKSMDCKIEGYIEKLISKEIDSERSYLTKVTGYWNIANSSEEKRVQSYMKKKGLELANDFEDINSLDGIKREVFYKNIYKYVVDKLNFDSKISLGIENSTRLGANTLTESSANAYPIDYTDFYIALLRKYNIPSRQVVGYVSKISGYTSDGFYHYWVEYFDSSTSKWITSDPFLEDYLKKDLFNNDFYDHITVLRRGKSTVSPNITFYSENDFKVEYNSSDEVKRIFEPHSELSFEKLKSTDKYLKGYIYLSNNGNIAITNYSVAKSNVFDLKKYIDPVNNVNSQILLPKQNANIQLNIPYNQITSSNIFVNMKFSNTSIYTKDLLSEQNISEVVPFYILLISKVSSLGIFFGFSFLVYFLVERVKKNG
ncbi:MAG: transglutaminase-like domain-containing protein [Candidatus Dojkabacteria bacterium]